MTAEVKRLDGTAVTVEEAKASPGIAELLEYLRKDNAAGKLRALVVCVVRDDGKVDTRWRWEPGGSLYEIIGAMELLKLDLLNSVNFVAIQPAEPA